MVTVLSIIFQQLISYRIMANGNTGGGELPSVMMK